MSERLVQRGHFRRKAMRNVGFVDRHKRQVAMQAARERPRRAAEAIALGDLA